ncbi:hypothetical protein A3715_18875 [Oleiphilus sp. HI0009]|nr:hypothetical protein A3715_18875 [Oleiphilus sp. HI0009]
MTRKYFDKNEDVFISIGDEWFVHVYSDRDVDDEAVLCSYTGRSNDGDLFFTPVNNLQRSVYGKMRVDKTEVHKMLYR